VTWRGDVLRVPTVLVDALHLKRRAGPGYSFTFHINLNAFTYCMGTRRVLLLAWQLVPIAVEFEHLCSIT